MLSHCPPPTIDEDILQSFITLDENIKSVEQVEALEIFFISDIRYNFVSLHNIQVSATESVDTQCHSFF